MNIISNNCIGGFIYRDILKEKYKNPFIWTAITDRESFIDLCKNFDTVNFKNISHTIDTTTTEATNRNALLIDGKYTLCFHRVWEDSRYEIPTVVKNWGAGINVCYKDPITYIREKYLERLARMEVSDDRLYVFYDAGKPYEKIDVLEEICEQQNAHGIILTSSEVKLNGSRILYLKTDDAWSKGNWAPVLLEHFSTIIGNFIKAISSYR